MCVQSCQQRLCCLIKVSERCMISVALSTISSPSTLTLVSLLSLALETLPAHATSLTVVRSRNSLPLMRRTHPTASGPRMASSSSLRRSARGYVSIMGSRSGTSSDSSFTYKRAMNCTRRTGGPRLSTSLLSSPKPFPLRQRLPPMQLRTPQWPSRRYRRRPEHTARQASEGKSRL